MKRRNRYRIALSLMLTVVMLMSLMVPVSAADSDSAEGGWDEGRSTLTVESVENDSVSAKWASDGSPAGDPSDGVNAIAMDLDIDETVRVSIVLEAPSTIEAGYPIARIADNEAAMSYRAGLRAAQDELQKAIEAQALGGRPLNVVWNLTLAANIISADVRRGDIEAIRAVPGVKDVFEETSYVIDDVTAGGDYTLTMAVSGDVDGATYAHLEGYYGQGMKIAIIDTGIDDDHQSFDPDAFMHAIEEDEEKDSKTYDLLTLNDIQELAEATEEPLLNAEFDATYFYMTDDNAKIPYRYNYADMTADNTSHDNDSFDSREHGSHVAGIAAANRYIKDEKGNFTDALEETGVVGNAPDAQLLVMKIASEKNPSFGESTYMAAIEDALVLGADVINLSLGSTYPGFVRAETDVYQSIMESLEESGAVITVAAGNNSYWSAQSSPSVYGNSEGLYNDAGTFDTVGSPGSYANSLTVASLSAEGGSDSIEIGESAYRFLEASFSTAVDGYRTDLPGFNTLGSTGAGTTHTYVMLSKDTAGYEAEALEALKDKNILSENVVIVWRGGITLADKATAAFGAGAKGEIIVNVRNDGEPVGLIPALNGYEGDMPVCSLYEKDGEDIWSAGQTEAQTFTYTVDGEERTGTYITGTLTVKKGSEGDRPRFADYTMSGFSSWGVPGDLSLKPDITAPGGDILSVDGSKTEETDQYETMSGTSMASPQMAGMAALVMQYLQKERKSVVEEAGIRALTQALLMGTAEPMRDIYGNYYPVFQQGSGRARVDMALSTPAYITVAGQNDGKAKAELGDDPEKTGVYTVTFTIHNMGSDDLNYALSADVFTQDAYTLNGAKCIATDTRLMGAEVTFTVTATGEVLTGDVASDTGKYDFDGDKDFDNADAQLLLESIVSGAALKDNEDHADVNGDGVVDTYDVHILLTLDGSAAYAVVPAGKELTVTATIELTGAERDRLEQDYEAGAYLEAYIFASPRPTEEGESLPELSFPILGYYGNWTDPSMTDLGTNEEWLETGEFERMPYLYAELAGMGTNLLAADGYAVPEGHSTGPNRPVNQIFYTLIRNAGDSLLRIYDADTGRLYWESGSLGGDMSAFYYPNTGAWQLVNNVKEFGWDFTDQNGDPIKDGTRLKFTLLFAPEYYAQTKFGYTPEKGYDWDGLTDGDLGNGELGRGAYLERTVTYDDVPPQISSAWYQELGGNIKIYANTEDQFPIVKAALFSQDGKVLMQELSEDIIGNDGEPIFEPSTAGGSVLLEFDGQHEYTTIGDVIWDAGVKAPFEPDVYLLQVVDEAGNMATYRLFVDIKETAAAENVTVSQESLNLYVGNGAVLTAEVFPMTLTDRSFHWTSDNTSVATVDPDGRVTAVAAGETDIRAVATLPGAGGKTVEGVCHVTVTEFSANVTGVVETKDGGFSLMHWQIPSGIISPDKEFEIDDTHFAVYVQKIDDSNFYLYDSEGYVYIYDSSDLSQHEKVEWSDYSVSYNVTGNAFAYSDSLEAPLFLRSNLLIIGRKNIYPYSWENNDRCKISLTYYGSDFYGMYVLDDERELEYEGTKYQYDTTVYLLGTDGHIIELYFKDGEQLANGDDVFYGKAPTDMTFKGTVDPKRSSLFLGADGALYVTLSTLDDAENYTNAVYRLVYSEEKDLWESQYLCSAGEEYKSVFLLDLTTGQDEAQTGANLIDLPDAVPESEASDEDNDTFNGAETAAEAAGTIPALALDSVDWAGTSASYGISTNASSHTVTVPIYITASTNGEFTLSYDSRLTLVSLTPEGSSALTDWEEKEGSVHAGYAGKDLMTQQLFTVTFSYSGSSAGTNAQFTLEVKQDGADRMPVTTEYTVYLPYIPTPVTPPEPDEPSKPDEPFKPVEPDHSGIVEVFDDVAKDVWYMESVDRVYTAGIMVGVTDSTFGPDLNVDRGMMAVMVYRLADSPAVQQLASFSDVKNIFYYAQAIAWANSVGVMVGRGDNMFAPTANITREEIAVVLWRLAGVLGKDTSLNADLAQFPDGETVSDWAKDAMCWAVGAGLFRGRDDGTLDPTAFATRAEVACVLSRCLDLFEE